MVIVQSDLGLESADNDAIAGVGACGICHSVKAACLAPYRFVVALGAQPNTGHPATIATISIHACQLVRQWYGSSRATLSESRELDVFA